MEGPLDVEFKDRKKSKIVGWEHQIELPKWASCYLNVYGI